MTGSQIEFPLSVAVCAWCKPRGRQRPGQPQAGLVSHGICLRHLKQFRLEAAGAKRPRRRRITAETVSAEALLL